MATIKTNTVYFGKNDRDIIKYLGKVHENFSSYVRRLIREDYKRSLSGISNTLLKEPLLPFEQEYTEPVKEEPVKIEPVKTEVKYTDAGSSIEDKEDHFSKYIETMIEKKLEELISKHSANKVANTINNAKDERALDSNAVASVPQESTNSELEKVVNSTIAPTIQEPKKSMLSTEPINNTEPNNEDKLVKIEDMYSYIENNNPVVTTTDNPIINDNIKQKDESYLKDVGNLLGGQIN